MDLVKAAFVSAGERDIFTASHFSCISVLCNDSGMVVDWMLWQCYAALFGIPLNRTASALQGDRVEVVIMTADGARTEFVDLKRD